MGPQDIKLAPDGSVYYIADAQQNGLWVLDGAATTVSGRSPPGTAHTGSASGHNRAATPSATPASPDRPPGSVHEHAPVDVERLTGHEVGVRRGEEEDR